METRRRDESELKSVFLNERDAVESVCALRVILCEMHKNVMRYGITLCLNKFRDDAPLRDALIRAEFL